MTLTLSSLAQFVIFGIADPNLRHKRAQILLDAIELMKSRPDIDPTRIGVWGGSQAGYVIPIALTQTEDIAFVICVSCAGESGNDEMGYQVMALGLCQDMPKEKSAERDRLLKELDQNRSYQTYAGYRTPARPWLTWQRLYRSRSITGR